MWIIDWRFEEHTRINMTFHFNSFADGEAILAENHDVVVATGGLPHTEVPTERNDLVVCRRPG